MSGNNNSPAGGKAPAGLNPDIILGFVIAGFGAALLLWIIPANVDDSGSFGLPPSLAPRALAWLITATGLVLMLQTLSTRSVALAGLPALRWQDVRHLAACVATVAAMLVIMKTVGRWIDTPYSGFFAAAPLGLILITLIHGRSPAWAYALNAVAIPLAIYGAFWFGLDLPLP